MTSSSFHGATSNSLEFGHHGHMGLLLVVRVLPRHIMWARMRANHRPRDARKKGDRQTIDPLLSFSSLLANETRRSHAAHFFTTPLTSHSHYQGKHNTIIYASSSLASAILHQETTTLLSYYKPKLYCKNMPSNYNGRGGHKKSDGKIADKVSSQIISSAFFCGGRENQP